MRHKNEIIKDIRSELFKWNRLQNNRCFFWRKRKLNYFQCIMMELLLQKTRAENAEMIIKKFINKFRSPGSLLNTKKKEIMEIIEPLGLQNQRYNTIVKISKTLSDNNENSLESAFGVGHYIANAVKCFYHNERVPIIDVNTSRVVSRLFTIDNSKDPRSNKLLFEKMEQLLPVRYYKKFNWILLDFGAQICKSRPNCLICPIVKLCNYNN